MQEYLWRDGAAWTEIHDGTWAKWNNDLSLWEPQFNAPPPPPPPPPAPVIAPVPARAGTSKPLFRSVAFNPRRIGVVVASVLVVALGLGQLSGSGVELPRPSGEGAAVEAAPKVKAPKTKRSLDDKINLAAERVREVDSFKVTASVTTNLPQGPMTMDARGAFDMRAGLGQLTMRLKGMESVPGVQALGDIEALYDFRDGFVFYMKWGGFTQLDPSISWLKVDMQALAKKAGFDFEALMQMDQGNPLQTVDYLEGVKDVQKHGREKVRGVMTQHYSGIIDFWAVMDKLPAKSAESIRHLIEASGVETVPVDVWLDRDGLPRRVSYDYSEAQTFAGSPAEGLGAMTMDFFDYGTPVHVTMPDPAEVTDFMEFMSRAGA